MNARALRGLALLLSLPLAACSGDGRGHDDASTADDTHASPDAARDGTVATDATTPSDAAPSPDASPTDVVAPPDAPADAPSTPDAATPSRWVTGYYVGYLRDAYPPAEVDFTAITHLVVGAVVPRTDGTLNTTFDIDNTAGPAMARDLAARAHAAGRRAVLMLGGAGSHDGWVASACDAHRAAFVSTLLSTMHDLGFDGLDLDWEPLETADEAPLRALAQALRDAEPGIVLTIPVGYVNANFPAVDHWYGDVAPLFDQINLMTYGMSGAWDGWHSWHSSAVQGEGPNTPTSVDSSVRAYLAAGVPAAKLGVGIGFYGQCWTAPVTAPGQALGGSTVTADDNVMSYANIVQGYYGTSAYHYDSAADAPYLSFAAAHGAQGCTFVSYEDATSIAAKGRYVRAQGLGGTIIWNVNEGHVASAPAGMRDPLLAAVRGAFLAP